MNKRKGFTLIELMIVMIILSILVAMGTSSFLYSQKRSRDSKRKHDLQQIAVSMEAYYNDNGRYPLADGTGRIRGCAANAAEVCTWGQVWRNTSTTPETIYMIQLPKDPTSANSYFYRTDADGSFYALYAYLENDEDEGDGVDYSGYTSTDCGPGECTYGIASSNTVP